jgi:glycosyltransferase involved in cell wall biosynthesis
MLSVVLCTYNRAAVLGETLASLGQLRGASSLPWELIVVDNNSTDATRETVRAAEARGGLPLTYRFEARQGKSHALNAGLARAAGEVIAFTDDDVALHPEWLAEMARAFDDPRCVAVGGRIIPVWPRRPPAWYSTQGPHRLMHAIVEFDLGEAPRVLDSPPYGANMAFRRAVVIEHGGFRTDLGPRPGAFRLGGGGEDTEFCRRLLQRGVPIHYLPSAIVYHPVEPERMTKRYFRRWYFNYGRALVRVSDLPASVPRYFGVPRYLLRELATELLRGQCALRPAPRARHGLEAYRVAGEIYEHLQRARGMAAPAPAGSCDAGPA